MRSQSSKHQEYTYTAQSVHTDGNSSVVDTEAGFWVQPPENSISQEYLFVDIVVEFHSSISLSDCKILEIGIVPSVNYQDNALPENRKMIEINKQAGADRRIYLKMNLTSLINKSRVSREVTSGDLNVPILTFPPEATAIVYDPSLGFDIKVPPNILWWKNDSLYTTVGQV